VIVGPAAKRPAAFALALLDRDIIDAGDAKPHQAVIIEFPVLVAVAAEPITAVVVPLIWLSRRCGQSIELREVPVELGPLVRHSSRRLRAIPKDNLLCQIDEGAQARGHVAASG
jgi:hypothetical protein